MKSKLFERWVGVAVVALVLLAVTLLWWGITVTHPPTLWAPVEITVGGVWRTLYNTKLPNMSVIAVAVGLALMMVLLVVVVERRVSARYRRTAPELTRRTLAPRALMKATRGRFDGEVSITVLIPAHNEQASIGQTLKALEEQQRRAERVIVVADNCTDDTAGVARRYGAEVFETVGNEHKKGGALNQALADLLPGMGPNDCVLVMDADSQIGPEYLATAVRLLSNDRALMSVGGLFLGEEGHGLIGQFQRNEYARYQREIRRRDGRVFVLTGTASVFRSGALKAVAEARGRQLPGRPGDVYDTAALTEDNELTIAIKSLGGLMTSPQQCTVVTELMPGWRMLWAQRLRWQRGALENLGAYGVTPQTLRYWSQQIGIGYGTIALFSYFALMVLMALAMDTWVWFPFWLGVGALFAVERVATVWRGGWRARLLAALVIPELAYDCFLDLAFLKGVVEILFGRRADWKHVEHSVPAQEQS